MQTQPTSLTWELHWCFRIQYSLNLNQEYNIIEPEYNKSIIMEERMVDKSGQILKGMTRKPEIHCTSIGAAACRYQKDWWNDFQKSKNSRTNIKAKKTPQFSPENSQNTLSPIPPLSFLDLPSERYVNSQSKPGVRWILILTRFEHMLTE